MAASEKLGGAFVELVLDANKYDVGIQAAKASLKSIAFEMVLVSDLVAGTLTRIGAALTVGVTVPIVAMAAKSTGAFAEMERTNQLVAREFGKNANDIRAWSVQIADAAGTTALAVQKAAGRFQLMFTNMGIAGERAAALSKELIRVGLNTKSFRGLAADEVFNRFQSALVGSSVAVRKLGINLSAARLKEIALAAGIDTAVAAMTEKQKVMLRVAGILADTTVAEGALAANATTLTALTERLNAAWTKLKTTWGTILGPINKVVTILGITLINAFKGVLDVLAKLPVPIRIFIGLGVAMVATVGPLLLILVPLAVVVLKVTLAIKLYNFAMATMAAVTGVASVQIITLSRVMTVLGFAIKKTWLAFGILGVAMIAASFALEFLLTKIFGADLDSEFEKLDAKMRSLTDSVKEMDSTARAATGLRTLSSLGFNLFQSGKLGIGGVSPAPALAIPAASITAPSLPSLGGSARANPVDSSADRRHAEQMMILREIETNTGNMGLA